MSVSSTPRLKVSREGMVLIKSFEGFRPRAVKDADGRWIIGYGHKASAREGLTVAEADAELLLQYDLLPVVKALNEQVREPLNQHQFDALASFAISIGVDRFLGSDVLQCLNEGHAGQAADALIGWPEDRSIDDRLRRRAAERALFVANPGSPVTLAELLAAPLPPPPLEIPSKPEAEVEPQATNARAAAVATLLGETAEPAATEANASDPSWANKAPAFQSPAFQPAEAVTRVNLDRYSPYSVAFIGPLPGLAPATPIEAPADAPKAPASTKPAMSDRVPEPEPEPSADIQPTQEFKAATDEVAAPLPPLETSAPAASPFPTMDPPLVLTPATEADFDHVERPVWPADQRTEAPELEEVVLFEDEPTLSVLRHEVEPAGPKRFDWADTGMYIFIGGLGLASCAFSAAAFRLAVEEPSPMGETVVLGWALALIGVICVGVSSWNLYVRWGKPD